MRRFALAALAIGAALLLAGCMGGGSSRDSRKAAISSEEQQTFRPHLELGGRQVYVRSFAWGANGGHARELQLSRAIDQNSPPWFRGTAEGTSYPNVTIDLIQPDGQTAATYVFSNVVVTSFDESVSSGESAVESMSLSYEKLDFTYGSANECFDFARQRAC